MKTINVIVIPDQMKPSSMLIHSFSLNERKAAEELFTIFVKEIETDIDDESLAQAIEDDKWTDDAGYHILMIDSEN